MKKKFYRCGVFILSFLLTIALTACFSSGENNSSFYGEDYKAFHQPEISTDEITQIVPNEALDMGKKLLEERDVGFDEVIRFPLGEKVYEAVGAAAITSVKEAKKLYPELPIPKKLGEYEFVDLTVDNERIREVGSNEVPAPTDKIEILDSKQLLFQQFFICYRKGISQFRINLFPMDDEDVRDLADNIINGFNKWDLHDDAYFKEKGSDESQTMSINLIIEPEKDGNYLFWVQKVSNADCLQSHTVEFSEDEADMIYKEIRKAF